VEKIRFKKLRLWIAYPFAVLYFIFAYQKGFDFSYGVWFVVLGALIRLWAAGFIKKIRELATCGPYMFVRNPLYLGNFLMGLGFCLFINNMFLSLLYIFLFFIFYCGTIQEEQILLTDLFGQEYIEYKKSVPAFFPLFKIYKSKQKLNFSLKQAYYNGEFIRILIIGILLNTLYFFQYFKIEKMLDAKQILWFGVTFFTLIILLVLSIIHRRNWMHDEQNQNQDI